MDPKASAKSKRTQTQQARRAHAPPAAIAHKKKAAAAAAAEKRASTTRSLPSNWDRYDDPDEELDANRGSKEGDDGEIKPKSKGADFSYLIEQARSQPKDFSSRGVDEVSSDFMQGGSSMLSVRGKGLLSMCGDDNFIVDDDSTSSYEVPFLSMDLNALATQLSKLKLSQLLSIESDLLPEELNDEEAETTSAPKKQEISEPAEFKHVFDSQASRSSPVLVNSANIQTHNNFMFKNDERNLEAEAGENRPDISPSSSSKQEDTSETRIHKTDKFEAAAAEAELDMLLDSLTETSISGSTNFGSIAPKIGHDSDSSRNVARTAIDDSTDDLLTETSSKQAQNSRFGLTSIDDSIDDLLAETSVSLKEQKPAVNQQNKGTVSPSKAMEDFDSWLDTL